jgi:hypothetical protein
MVFGNGSTKKLWYQPYIRSKSKTKLMPLQKRSKSIHSNQTSKYNTTLQNIMPTQEIEYTPKAQQPPTLITTEQRLPL